VVNHDVLLASAANGVIFLRIDITHSAADEANDDIVGIDIDGIALDADALSGGRLSKDGDVAIANGQRRVQVNGS